MPRKRKRGQFDDYDDWQEAPTADDVQPEQEVEKVSLEDFCVMEKVDAFTAAYQPCDEDTDGAEFFDDSRLRELLKAYVCGLGDPLKLYIRELAVKGFRMTMNTITCEPGIYAVRRY